MCLSLHAKQWKQGSFVNRLKFTNGIIIPFLILQSSMQYAKDKCFLTFI